MVSKETQAAVAASVGALPHQRSSLLPALWAIADRMGYIDEERTEALADTLHLPVAEVYGVASFYRLLPTRPGKTVRVCDDLICRLKGSRELLAGLSEAGLEAVEWPCLGRCDRAPAVLAGRSPVVKATVDKVLAEGGEG